MIAVSFSKTTAALKARRKTVTRREWKDAHAAKFRPGMLVEAWSASPHRGGERVGALRIVSVAKEPTRLIPESDWEAEGFAYMAEHGLNVAKDLSCEALWRLWRQSPDKETWVIRFEVVYLYEEGGMVESVTGDEFNAITEGFEKWRVAKAVAA